MYRFCFNVESSSNILVSTLYTWVCLCTSTWTFYECIVRHGAIANTYLSKHSWFWTCSMVKFKIWFQETHSSVMIQFYTWYNWMFQFETFYFFNKKTVYSNHFPKRLAHILLLASSFEWSPVIVWPSFTLKLFSLSFSCLKLFTIACSEKGY